MGSQQILLLVLTVIVVGVAITAGIGQFNAQSTAFHKDAMVMDLNNVAQSAIAFKAKTVEMGGGGDSYAGYSVPVGLGSNANGTYTAGSGTSDAITFTGTSAKGYGTITLTLNDTLGSAYDFSGFTGN